MRICLMINNFFENFCLNLISWWIEDDILICAICELIEIGYMERRGKYQLMLVQDVDVVELLPHKK